MNSTDDCYGDDDNDDNDNSDGTGDDDNPFFHSQTVRPRILPDKFP